MNRKNKQTLNTYLMCSSIEISKIKYDWQFWISVIIITLTLIGAIITGCLLGLCQFKIL